MGWIVVDNLDAVFIAVTQFFRKYLCCYGHVVPNDCLGCLCDYFDVFMHGW